MENRKLSDLVKGAVKVNLNYSASLLNLSKDYIKAMSEALTNANADAEQPESPDAPPSTRIPLIVAGRAGDIANATFALHNTSGVKGNISLQVQGEFEGLQIELDPNKLELDINANVLVRILAKISDKTPLNQDMPGTVLIPELGLRVAEFVVRRLEDKPAPARPKKSGKH